MVFKSKLDVPAPVGQIKLQIKHDKISMHDRGR